MKKHLTTLSALFLTSLIAFAQTDSTETVKEEIKVAKYYVLGLKKDTTKCFELTRSPFGDLKCKCEDGKKRSFDVKEVFSFKIRERVGGENSSKWGVRTYFAKPMSGEKDAVIKFMSKVVVNKDMSLFMYLPKESSGPYGTSTASPKYFLFDKDKYLDELTELNEKKYLSQLYEGCDRAVAKSAEEIDFITKLDEATRIYRERCENQ